MHAGILINVLYFYILCESGLLLQYFLRPEKIRIMKMDLAGHWTIWFFFFFSVILFESAFPIACLFSWPTENEWLSLGC